MRRSRPDLHLPDELFDQRTSPLDFDFNVSVVDILYISPQRKFLGTHKDEVPKSHPLNEPPDDDVRACIHAEKSNYQSRR